MSSMTHVDNRVDNATLEVLLLGLGGVGRSLLRQLLEQRATLAAHYGLSVNVLALADSSALLAPAGNQLLLDEPALCSALEAKERGAKLASLAAAQPVAQPENVLRLLANRLTPRTVVVDCTATEATVPALLMAVDAGCKVVLANKKPLTVQQEVYNRLTRAGATGARRTSADAVSDAATATLGPLPAQSSAGVDAPLGLGRVRWETTCGAGLPVIGTLNRLMMCGDPIHRIAGALSGTLGYVMTGLQEGRPLSEVVREAHRLGYTEPDPRDDLGGLDVARKALILARGLGWQMDLADVEVEGLYPEAMADLSVAAFMDALPQLDAAFAERVHAAAANGDVLRYAAVVEEGRCRVGPTVVPASSPLGQLAGADNLIEFHTRWYSPAPLVIQGRGAGADATAAGVLSDIVELGFTY